MALKDWKKISEYYYIDKFHSKQLFIRKNNYSKYNVYSYSFNGNNEINKFFKTKSQALKFAKSYMRTH